MDVSTHTAFQLRLQWLEAILDNPQPTIRQSPLVLMDASRSRSERKADWVDGEDGEDQHKRDVTQRTGDLAQQVRNALLETGHESLRRLIDECKYTMLVSVTFRSLLVRNRCLPVRYPVSVRPLISNRNLHSTIHCQPTQRGSSTSAGRQTLGLDSLGDESRTRAWCGG